MRFNIPRAANYLGCNDLGDNYWDGFGSDGWNRTNDLGIMNLMKQWPVLFSQ